MAIILSNTDDSIARAVTTLRAGELIGLPTETVYGLAADASNIDAVAKIFALKGRPANHPLIVHLANADLAKTWASDWSPAAEKLAQAFWPGPMTLIVKRAAHVLDAVTGGQDTVGLRVPSHPLALTVLREFGGGLAAPSANKFGHVSPTSAAHVASEFADDELLILDGGACDVGVESTIIDVSGGDERVRILRPGRIRAHEVERVLEAPLAKATQNMPRANATQNTPRANATQNTPRVSGSLDSHYAPRKKTLMLEGEALDIFLDAARDAGKRIGLIHHSQRFANKRVKERIHLDGSSAQIFEHDIYAKLRALDDSSVDLIVIEMPPSASDWDAVNDRLRRATFSNL
jgi:L-threonylcarbamoyladenylate synthase